MKCTTYREAIARYGDVDVPSCTWRGEAQWMVLFDVPQDIASSWINAASGRGMPTRRIYCNQDLVGPLRRALENIRNAGLTAELKTFDGCFDIRLVGRGSGKVSTHAYGLAIDINAAENPQGAPPTLSLELVHCWEDAGFDWGGRFQRSDGMHFSYAWETTHNPVFDKAVRQRV